MERITIIDKNNVKLTLLISNNTIYYINHNNSKIDINKYIDMLRIDNVTDYFNNNGSFCICYKNNGVEKTNTKKFRIKDTIVLCSLTALLLISPIISIFSSIFSQQCIFGKNCPFNQGICLGDTCECLDGYKTLYNPKLTVDQQIYCNYK